MEILGSETKDKLLDVLTRDDCDLVSGLNAIADDDLEKLRSALQVTPQQYQKWLLELFINDEPYRNFPGDVLNYGFVRSVLDIIELALAPSHKSARRGYSWNAREQLRHLRNSPYAKFDDLFAECITKDAQYIKYYRGHGIDAEQNVACCSAERSLAIQHLPEIISSSERIIELLKPVLAEPIGCERNWAAVHLSLLTPDDSDVSRAVIDSLFHTWVPSEPLYRFGAYSGQVLSALAFLTLGSRKLQEFELQNQLLAQVANISRCDRPADKGAAESAVHRLYVSLGSSVPNIEWRRTLRPLSDWDPDDVQLSLAAPEQTTVEADPNQDGPVSLTINVEHDTSFEGSLRNLCDALYIALQWHAERIFAPWDVGEPEEVWQWPPTWTPDASTAPLASEWRSLLQKTLVLNETLLEGKHWRPIVTQLDYVWLGLLDFLAKALEIEDSNLTALTDVAKHCGGAYLASNKNCLLFERPQSQLWHSKEHARLLVQDEPLPLAVDETRKVSDLSADELAAVALARGCFNPNIDSFACKAIYVATENSVPKEALKVLAYMTDYVAHHALSTALNEYLLDLARDEDTKNEVLVPRAWRITTGGPVEQIGSNTLLRIYFEEKYLPQNIWDLVLKADETRLADLISTALGPDGQLSSAFDAVRNMLGVQAGLIKHRVFGNSVPQTEFYFSDKFEKTEQYKGFLDSTIKSATDRTISELSSAELAAIAARLWWNEGQYVGPVAKALYHATELDLPDLAIRLMSSFITSAGVIHLSGPYLKACRDYLFPFANNEVTLRCVNQTAESPPWISFSSTGSMMGLEELVTQIEASSTQAASDSARIVASDVNAPRSAFETIRRIIGVHAGLLRHKKLGWNVPASEFEFPDRFERTSQYDRFLQAKAIEIALGRQPRFRECTQPELLSMATTLFLHKRWVSGARAMPIAYYATNDGFTDEGAVALARSMLYCGRDQFSAALIESLSCMIESPTKKTELASLRMRLLKQLKLASQITHSEYCSGAREDQLCCSSSDIENFAIDKEALESLMQVTVGNHTPREIYNAARIAVGLCTQLLKHKTLGGEVTDQDLFCPDQFVRTERHDCFLDCAFIDVEQDASGKLHFAFANDEKSSMFGKWSEAIEAGLNGFSLEDPAQLAKLGAKLEQ